MPSQLDFPNQLNTVRTYLCKVKGGGLAGSISPATIISLIISDVIGDPINFIASGPTLPNKVNILEFYPFLFSTH